MKPLKILLIGSSGRLDCMLDSVHRSHRYTETYVISTLRNDHFLNYCDEYFVIEDLSNLISLLDVAKKIEPDLTIIGPEKPLVAGIVDLFGDNGFACVGPNRLASRIEGSKAFCRRILGDLMYESISPKYKEFHFASQNSEIMECFEEMCDYVIKPDGLTGGKGVWVKGDHFDTDKEGLEYTLELLKDGKVLIEEQLIGKEFSLISFTDGITIRHSFPVQDNKRAFNGDVGPNCYSEDTEVLTNNGWKYWPDVLLTDQICILKDNEIVFETPVNLTCEKFIGDMIGWESPYIDILVTPGHNMYVQDDHYRKDFFFEPAFKTKDKNRKILRTCNNWGGKSLNELLPSFYNGTFNDWCKFMGIFIADGYASKRGEVRFNGLPLHKQLEFSEICKNCGFSFKLYGNELYLRDKDLATYLKQFGLAHEKYVPEYIRNGHKDDILSFLEGYALGDGTRREHNLVYTTVSKLLADNVQELCLKVGWAANIKIRDRSDEIVRNGGIRNKRIAYEIKVSKTRQKCTITSDMYYKKQYSGNVYCATVSSHIMYVRRNGKPSFQGNTGGMGSISFNTNSLPFLTEEDILFAKGVNASVLKQLNSSLTMPYKGFLYGGFIKTDNGIKVIEYNCRFGDPEVMNILPIMKTDFVDLCEAIVEGTLIDVVPEFEEKATVCKYIVPEGYPEFAKAGGIISNIPESTDTVRVFQSSVESCDEGLRLCGSRAIAIVGIGENMAEAGMKAEQACKKIKGPIRWRSDIGTIKHLKKSTR